MNRSVINQPGKQLFVVYSAAAFFGSSSLSTFRFAPRNMASVMACLQSANSKGDEVLIKQFIASYSASRGALLEFWKSVRMFRRWFAYDFCQAVFEELLAEAVAKGRIAAPGFFSDPAIRKAYSGAEWNGPAQGLLNPVHEVRAAEIRVANGFSTRDREAQEQNGSDFYKNIGSRKREEKLMQEIENIKRETENTAP